MLSHPHPPLLFINPPPLPQQLSKRMIQIQELHPPLLLSHPHPQFVAAKSLIFKSSINLITVYYMRGACNRCGNFIKKIVI